ncbi:MAG: hypothetical protein L6428_12600 [Candidatus Aminicenantes bacterium]|nr:hypothetical protein [Acidobacteriota bacterium]MCG2812273.1 hypothetical protein [Candidatus Aminicenantes bacterium]
MVKQTKLSAVFLMLALAFSLPAAAADYYFKVNILKAVLTVQPDSSVEIRYAITFSPETGSHPVDIVDIGMPNENYDIRTARAAIAGIELNDIRNSQYVKPGVEIHLGGNEILPGQTGTLEFAIKVGQMIYPDSDDSRFASLQFKTTWFDRKYISGNAELLEIQFNLPPGTTPEKVKYHGFGRSNYQPSETSYQNNRVVYIWRWLGRPASVPYTAGASFPRDLVTSVYSPPRPSVLKALLTAFFAFFGFVFALTPLWIIALIIFIAVRSGRKRMKQYLPPRIGIESGGIKRGLTPPEAALLQELPVPQVLLLIVFGLLKKETLAIKEIAPKDFRFHYYKKEGLDHQEYETSFITAIDGKNCLKKTTLRKMFTDMITALQKKMTGFSRRETNMYYLSIMNKAWEQIKNSPREKLPEELAASLEWLALDPEYENKLGPYTEDALFTPGSRDYWYRHFPQRTTGTGASTVPGKGYGQTVSGAASRFVQSLQVFSGALIGESAAFTSAITKVTNPPPVAQSSGSGSHGGSSCACACACAGCACACAGGGR